MINWLNVDRMRIHLLNILHHSLKLNIGSSWQKFLKYTNLKKFNLIYTGRIYKIFFKKRFIKLNCNRSHRNIVFINLPKLYTKNFIYEKMVRCWLQTPRRFWNSILSTLIKIRPLNLYTWRGWKLEDTPWTKKPGKISEYV